MTKRILNMLLGLTLSSFGITCVIKSGLGCFSVTAMNMAFANWFGITIGMSGMILELIMLSIATYRGEGIGVTSIANATYGSLMIDVFNYILPSHPLMVLGLFILPIGWAIIGSKKVALGDTGSNILMNSILKHTDKNIGLIRGIQEGVYLTIGILGARECVTWFTILLTLGLGYLLQFMYKLIKYVPTETNHDFIIERH